MARKISIPLKPIHNSTRLSETKLSENDLYENSILNENIKLDNSPDKKMKSPPKAFLPPPNKTLRVPSVETVEADEEVERINFWMKFPRI